MADNSVDNGANNGGNRFQDRLLGWFLVLMPFAIFALLVGVWPTASTDAKTKVITLTPTLSWFKCLGNEGLLMVIVLLSGALGSAIHAARSYGYFHGQGAFGSRWYPWYWLRLPMGMGLALVVYLALRGGLFAGNFGNDNATTSFVNPFGFAALAALTGMFAKQATGKLEEIFDNVFRTETPVPKPPVVDLPVGTLTRGASEDADLTVTLSGSGFDRAARVSVGGKERAAVYKSPGEIQVKLDPADAKKAGRLDIVVTNPTGKGGASRPVSLVVA